MARPGPPPKPTRLKAIAGNPGRRPLNRREPRPAVKAPICPTWLSSEARKVWRATIPLLKDMGVLARVDRDALTAYCQTFARWKAAEEFLDRHGPVFPLKDEKGNIRCMMPFPQVAIARSLLQMLRGYQQEFGLTPSARSRLEVEPPREPNAFDEFMEQARQMGIARARRAAKR